MEFNSAIVVTVFAVVIALLIWDRTNRAVVTLMGASVLVLLVVLDQNAAISAIDFNTIGLIVSMSAVVAVCRKSGMFHYLAVKSAKLADGNLWRILALGFARFTILAFHMMLMSIAVSTIYMYLRYFLV